MLDLNFVATYSQPVTLLFWHNFAETLSLHYDFVFNKSLLSPLFFPFMWYHLSAHKHALALFILQGKKHIDSACPLKCQSCLHYFTSFLNLLQPCFSPHYWNKTSWQVHKNVKLPNTMVSSILIFLDQSLQHSSLLSSLLLSWKIFSWPLWHKKLNTSLVVLSVSFDGSSTKHIHRVLFCTPLSVCCHPNHHSFPGLYYHQ